MLQIMIIWLSSFGLIDFDTSWSTLNFISCSRQESFKLLKTAVSRCPCITVESTHKISACSQIQSYFTSSYKYNQGLVLKFSWYQSKLLCTDSVPDYTYSNPINDHYEDTFEITCMQRVLLHGTSQCLESMHHLQSRVSNPQQRK